jgi:LysR family glycine cleavage system transcriptional activator
MATLEAFEAAARLGSFSAAAAELHLTPGAVSRQMAALEGDLGITLFSRAARGVALTPAGQRLLCRRQRRCHSSSWPPATSAVATLAARCD